MQAPHVDRWHVFQYSWLTVVVGYAAFTEQKSRAVFWGLFLFLIAMTVWCVWRRFVQPEEP